MTRFTMQNTDYQFSAAELAELNAQFDDIMEASSGSWGEAIAFGHEDDISFKSWQDGVAEQLMAAV